MARTLSGERVFPDAAPSVELNKMWSADVTPRQMEVLRRFVQGMTYSEIAAELNMTANGVRWNLDQVVAKGEFKSKHELLTAALDKKLIVTVLQDEPDE